MIKATVSHMCCGLGHKQELPYEDDDGDNEDRGVNDIYDDNDDDDDKFILL